MAINPRNPNELLVGTDGGVYRLTYTPSTGAVNIVGLNATLGITQFYAAAFHPTDPTRFGIIRRVFCLWNAGARHNPRRNNAKQRDTLDCVCRSTFRSRRGN
jgi:hypothetical protein